MTRDARKTLKKEKNEKRKVQEKFKQQWNSLLFCTWKRIYFARKHSLRKCSLYYNIFSKALLVLQGI